MLVSLETKQSAKYVHMAVLMDLSSQAKNGIVILTLLKVVQTSSHFNKWQ
jgi:hypothetical protein